jgi:hypothetical protein
MFLPWLSLIGRIYWLPVLGTLQKVRDNFRPSLLRKGVLLREVLFQFSDWKLDVHKESL